MRTFVLGDIHGAWRALKQVLWKCGIDREKDRLIFVGDICDGWPEVRQCVDELLTFKDGINILGNHDEWFLRWLSTGVHPDHWTQGGEGTLLSYAEAVDKVQTEDFGDGYQPLRYAVDLNPYDVPVEHHHFFKRMVLYHHDTERNYCFVHGGFSRISPIRDQAQSNPRELYWNRTLWNLAQGCEEGVKLKTKDDFDLIFIGHTATTSFRVKETFTEGGIIMPWGEKITWPMYRGGIWNVDTGAGWDGKLTIMDVDTKEYWQSDPVKELYPDVRGR